jgi:hypothetical protein
MGYLHGVPHGIHATIFGSEIFYSHGIKVPRWMIETPSEEIDPSRMVELKNVDQRREFIRIVGIERIAYKMGMKTLDKDTIVTRIPNPDSNGYIKSKVKYELVLVNLGDGSDRLRPYLKMENPSLPGLWHLEGVPPTIKKVSEALKWRNGTQEVPEVLT